MARNRFDQDENLETPFKMAHLLRSLQYVSKYKFQMFAALATSILGMLVIYYMPLITSNAIDIAIKKHDINMLVFLSIEMAACIIIYIILFVIKGVIVAIVAQKIIHDIRKDLFHHLQELPFSYYDSRPAGQNFGASCVVC